MYIPKHFNESDRDILREVIRDHGFATLVTATGRMKEPLAITHLPLLLDGPDRLIGHMARVNSHWKDLAENLSTAIFHGPHGYVSPRWYEDESYVPTWNYITVHVRGTVRIMEDADELRSVLERLSAQYEADMPSPWSPDLLADKSLGNMMRGIVGFEMEITDWQGKFKLSQNKSGPAQQSLKSAMQSSPHPDDRAMLAWMERLED